MKEYTCAAVPSVRNMDSAGCDGSKFIVLLFVVRNVSRSAARFPVILCCSFFSFPISLFCGATVLLFSLSCPLVSCAVCFFSQSDPFGVRMLSTAWGMEPWGYPCAEQLLAVVLSWALCLERPMAPCFQRRITTCYF